MTKDIEMDKAYYFALTIKLSGEALNYYANNFGEIDIMDCVRKAILDYKNDQYLLDKMFKDVCKVTIDVWVNKPSNKNIEDYAKDYMRFSKKFFITFYYGGKKRNRYQEGKLHGIFNGFDGLKIGLYDGNGNITIHENGTSSKICIKNGIPLITLDSKSDNGGIGGIFIRNENYSYRIADNIDDVIKILEEVLKFDYDLCIIPDYRRYKDFMKKLLDRLCDGYINKITISKFVSMIIAITTYPSDMNLDFYTSALDDKKPLNKAGEELLSLFKAIILKDGVTHNTELELFLIFRIYEVINFKDENDALDCINKLKNIFDEGKITIRKRACDLEKSIKSSYSIEKLIESLTRWSKEALLERKEDIELSLISGIDMNEDLDGELKSINTMLEIGEYEV